MNEQDKMKNNVSYLAYESAIAKDERTINKLIMVMIILIIGWSLTIGFTFWYISLPVEEYMDQQVEDIDNSTITQKVGE